MENVSFAEESKACLMSAGGVEAVVAAMSAHPEDAIVQASGCGALTQIGAEHHWAPATPETGTTQENGTPVNTLRIANAWGVEAVVSAMQHHPEDAIVQASGCGALQNIGVAERTELRIAEVGGVEAVVAAMDGFPEDPDVQASGCGALQNIGIPSRETELRIAKSGGLEAIVMAMGNHAEDPMIQACGCGALQNVSFAPENKSKIRRIGGIEAVVRAMKNHEGDAQIQASGCAVLENLQHGDRPETRVNGILVPEAWNDTTESRTRIVALGGVEAVEAAMSAHPDNAVVQEEGVRLLMDMGVMNFKNKGQRSRL